MLETKDKKIVEIQKKEQLVKAGKKSILEDYKRELPQKLETAFNMAINKLRKLNQEQETPIYYKRAKKNKGERIVNSEEINFE